MAEPARKQGRGIQNVQIEQRAANDNYAAGPTQRRLEEELLSSERIARDKERQREQKTGEGITPDAKIQADSGLFQTKYLRQIHPNKASKKKGQGVIKRRIRLMTQRLIMQIFLPFIVPAILLLYVLQFGFAALSATAFGVYAGYKETLDSLGLVGKTIETVVSKLTDFVNAASQWLIGIDVVIPLNYAGIVFWVLASVAALFSFIILYLCFFAMGIRPFLGSVFLFFTTSIFLILSFIPFLNIFPWVIVWGIYIYSTNLLLFKTKK